MWGRPRTPAHLAALVAAWWCAACATHSPVTVVHDASDELAGYRTWDWIEGQALVIRAPTYDIEQVGKDLAEIVESELSARGLVRTPGTAELRVAALLVSRRTLHSFRRPTAMQTLSSFHEVQYEVQSEVTDLRPVDRYRLSLFVTGPRQERVLWQAELTDQRIDGFVQHLPEAVETLLAEFPAPGAETAD